VVQSAFRRLFDQRFGKEGVVDVTDKLKAAELLI
jgi:hypothetical protein